MRDALFARWNRLKRRLANTGIARVPGVPAVSRAMHRLLAPRHLAPVSVNGVTLWVNPGDTAGVAPPLLQYGEYEPFITKVFSRIVKPGMTVVDAGANIGYYTTLAAKLAGPRGKVIAFEPEPRNFTLLQRNIAANGFRNCIAVNEALADKAGSLTLHLDATNWGAHSLAQQNVRGTRSVTVRATTLDAFFARKRVARVDVIKMDTQGAEGRIVQGMRRTLARNKHLRIIMEFWPFALRSLGTDPEQLLEWLRSKGFCIAQLDDSRREIVPVQDAHGLAQHREHCWATNLLLER